MQKIHKFALPKGSIGGHIRTSESAEFLDAEIQNGVICLWFLVQLESPSAIRYFEVFGTGWSIPSDDGFIRKYLDTVHDHGNGLVWHIFEKTAC